MLIDIILIMYDNNVDVCYYDLFFLNSSLMNPPLSSGRRKGGGFCCHKVIMELYERSLLQFWS